MTITTEKFGNTPDGAEVTKYTLVNAAGNSIAVMNWGASLLEVNVPDRSGQRSNINLCFDSLQPYVDGHPYYGATVGRYCNRIRNARFTIDGVEYRLTANVGEHHIHGGKNNFTYQFWSAVSGCDERGDFVRFQLISPDGSEGYPGTVKATVDYCWNDGNELILELSAETDAPTHVSLCNHSYWNLSGAGSGDILNHVAQIDAAQYLDVDSDLIPTGLCNDITGTPLDFQLPQPIGGRIAQLASTNGYDHCYVVGGEAGQLRSAARVYDPDSGRALVVETTQPGVQFYTANNLAGDKKSGGHRKHSAFCLETQRFPNSPNVDSFPSTLLRPGEQFQETTVHRFELEQ